MSSGNGERLGDVVVSSKVQAADAIGLFAPCGQHQHGNLNVFRSQLPAQLEAAHARKHEVEDDQIGLLVLVEHVGRFAVGRRDHLVLLESQIVRDRSQDAGIVFDDEHLRHACACRGMRTENVLPRPGWLTTAMRPRCASTTWSASGSPSPAPAMPAVSID